MKSTQKAYHILEMPGLGEFCGFCFKNDTYESRLTNKCSKLYKNQRLTLSRLATVILSWVPL